MARVPNRNSQKVSAAPQGILMAVCEIWDVRGRLDHPIDYAENPEKTANPKYTEADLQAMVDVMEYATNKDKTEQRFFVTGVNCDPTTARDEMMIAKAQWNDRSEIVCYHGFQSFKSGEVTPEQAHEVGVRLAERMWGDRFQVIVATHLNTACLHHHFVVNFVSFADGKHYHDNKANLRLLRQHSDELCREYALSVIEHPSGKKKPYALYQAEKQCLPTASLSLCSTKHPQTVSSLPSSLISLTFSSVISRMSAQDRDFSRLEALLCRLSTNSHAIPSFTS